MATQLPPPPAGYTVSTAPGQLPPPPPGYALDQSAPEQKSVGGFLSNTLSSAGNLIGDAASAVAHPFNTGEAIGAIPVGIYEKLGGGGTDGTSAKMLDAMLDHLKGRYGSLDNAKETLYKDPVGVMADISTLFGGAGLAGDAAKLGKVADIASTISRVTDPIAAVGRPVAAVAKAGVRAGAKAAGLDAAELYRTALKPRINTDVNDVRQMVDTGLNNSIPVSEKGAQKLESLVRDLQQKIDAKTQAAGAAGVTVDPRAVAQRTDSLVNRFSNQVNPSSDLKAIDRSRQEFLSNNSIPGSPGVPSQPTGILGPNGQPIMSPARPATPTTVNPIPADQAQRMKTGTYQKIRDDYGTLSVAQIESQKALARGIKEELNAQIPELADLNEKEAKMLGLQPVLESAVNKASNRSSGFKNLISAGAAGALSGSPVAGVAYGVIQKIMEDPAVRSRLAIAINTAQQKNPGRWGAPSMATAISRVNAYAPGQAAESPAGGSKTR